MFESSSRSSSRALVAVTLADGTASNLSIRLPLSNKLSDALNGADPFLDVLTPEGVQMFIAKSQVKSVRLVDVPRANQLNLYRRASDEAAFDPHATLKVKKGATAEEIRAAYHSMARLYHPDRLAAYELPEEVRDYARAMQVRINLAFEQIGR